MPHGVTNARRCDSRAFAFGSFAGAASAGGDRLLSGLGQQEDLELDEILEMVKSTTIREIRVGGLISIVAIVSVTFFGDLISNAYLGIANYLGSLYGGEGRCASAQGAHRRRCGFAGPMPREGVVVALGQATLDPDPVLVALTRLADGATVEWAQASEPGREAG